MLAALLAAFVTAPVLPASAGSQAATADITMQVWTCPDDYAGTDYLTDCTPGPAGTEVLFTDDIDFTGPPGTGTYITDFVDADGFSTQTLPAGDTLAVVQLAADTYGFYHACFDTTVGSEVYLFDGATNGAVLSTVAGGTYSCRFYVIPSSAGPPPPTTANGVFQVYVCETDYAGDANESGCVRGPQGIPFSITGDGGAYVQDILTSQSGTAHDSTLPPGLISISIDPTESVYPRTTTGIASECYDTTNVYRELLVTSDVGLLDFPVVAGGEYECDFFVTPQDVAPVPANIAVQVFDCPVEYDGDDYLTDCAPTPATDPAVVYLNEGTDFDIDTALEGTTGAEGRTLFESLPAGPYLMTLWESERVNTFYIACFDATSGEEVYLFDGNGIQYELFVQPGDLLSCRWYVIPQAIASPSASASAAASVAPSTVPSARPSGPVTGLPSTGTGASDTTMLPLMGMAAVALVALAGAGLVTRRLVTARI